MTVTASGQPGFSRPAGRPVPVVLVVEDQPQLQRALRISLRARQYEVLTAGTGREALATAAASPPDAMILDLGLPDVDGTEVIVAFRGWSRAPIIVLSGRTSPGDKIGALDAGADDYVTKPFAMGELLARLRAALRRDEPADQLGPAAGRRVGSRLPEQDQLPALPHGTAAPQARAGPVAAAQPADRAGHGLPLPADQLAHVPTGHGECG